MHRRELLTARFEFTGCHTKTSVKPLCTKLHISTVASRRSDYTSKIIGTCLICIPFAPIFFLERGRKIRKLSSRLMLQSALVLIALSITILAFQWAIWHRKKNIFRILSTYFYGANCHEDFAVSGQFCANQSMSPVPSVLTNRRQETVSMPK